MPLMVDPSSITSSLLAELITASFKAAVSGASASVKSSWSKIFEDFSPYMEDTYNRNRNIRILCKKDTDVDLYDVYVNSTFISSGVSFSDTKLIEDFVDGKNIIINGNGGAGKTLFMRHLWLTVFANPGSVTPIFIELRQLGDLSKVDLKTFIRRTISARRELTEDLFDYFCHNGRFCFLLDGFDEIPQEHRDDLQKQILNLASTFKKCSFAVSSRFEKRFSGWQNFTLFESSPFNLEQVILLIKKVPFDESSKRLFLGRLNISFFRQNESFLSNPLLAIMMMMTFRENMDIPRRMNIFYDQAFNTLFQWHDATKAYTRDKVLDISDFQKSFGMFCLLSYYREAFEFTRSDIISYIAQSSEFFSFNHAPEAILGDYEQSVNLIKQDGLKYTFIHRSFQEYFAAYALIRIVPDKFSQFIAEIQRRTSDAVMSICHEMNSRLMIREYLQPEMDKWKRLGLFNFKRDCPYYILNKTDTKYVFMRSRLRSEDHGDKRKYSGAVSMRMNEEITRFVENVRRMMGRVNSHGSGGFTNDFLFTEEMFRVFGEANQFHQKISSLNIEVGFGPTAVKTSVVDQDDGISDKAAEASFAQVLSSEDCFSKVESRLRAELREIASWCESEISKAEKGGRSLNDILGIR